MFLFYYHFLNKTLKTLKHFIFRAPKILKDGMFDSSLMNRVHLLLRDGS